MRYRFSFGSISAPPRGGVWFAAAAWAVSGVFAVPVWAQKSRPRPAVPAVQAPVAPPWRVRLDQALGAPVLRNAQVGVLVRSLDNGRVLYEKNPDFALVPASNMKIVTATTALAKLGTGFRFTTTVLRTGAVDKNGTLNGDLYLKGSGDPSLSSERLMLMAQAVYNGGIKRVTGRIVGDASRFDDRTLGDGWQWDDEPFSYQPQVSGLNCDENVIRVEVTPGRAPGEPALVTVGGPQRVSLGFEKSRYVSIVSTVTTIPSGGASSGAVVFDRARGKNELRVSGSVVLGALPTAESLTIEDPARYAANRFADLLVGANVNLPGADRRRVEVGVTPPDAVAVTETNSDSLPGLLKYFLKNSDNLYGETLLKAVGAASAKNGQGTTSGGAQAAQDFLRDAGVPASGLSVADGSGLSRLNNVTPRLLAVLLTYASQKFPSDAQAAFRDALPVGGVDGTLRGRFKGTPAEGRVQAKTGTLSGASSLSGYVTTNAGERLVFSILMNNYASGGRASEARAAQDAVVLALLSVPAPPVPKSALPPRQASSASSPPLSRSR